MYELVGFGVFNGSLEMPLAIELGVTSPVVFVKQFPTRRVVTVAFSFTAYHEPSETAESKSVLTDTMFNVRLQ